MNSAAAVEWQNCFCCFQNEMDGGIHEKKKKHKTLRKNVCWKFQSLVVVFNMQPEEPLLFKKGFEQDFGT